MPGNETKPRAAGCDDFDPTPVALVRLPEKIERLIWVVDPFEGTVCIWDRETGPDAPRKKKGTLRWAFPEEADEALELDVAGLVGPP